ncbi:hypothetical protein QFZ52_001881 [Arthrobacter woluwensis]|uniref:hypothetical protein n=1 Tax=Arthrobacter woluwensis TaxID=156980 RepID=UPI002781FB48|nr:hypothetical protein [Arthrobacter woluwensis]MDQ0709229.1 hypothetical protein [Arthrobacter woluwensis]
MLLRTETLEGSSPGFEVQTVEIVEGYLLVRLRVDDERQEYVDTPRGVRLTRRSLLADGVNLSDESGNRLSPLQSAGFSDGPFAGMEDIAFPLMPSLSLEDTLTLETADVHLRFAVVKPGPTGAEPFDTVGRG